MAIRQHRFVQKTLSLFTEADLTGSDLQHRTAPDEPSPATAEPEDNAGEADDDAWYDIRVEDEVDDGPEADLSEDEPDEDEPDEDESDDDETDGANALRAAQPYSLAKLQALYDELNDLSFDGILPPCEMKWSRRLTRAAGTIRCERRLVTLSVPLLVDPFVVPGAAFEICGVICDSYESALREILKHEMIHLWLYVQKLPHGHTPAFRAKARAIGQPRTRHNIALPPPMSGWIYSCSFCPSELHRRRRFSRPVACASCCKRHSRGKYDERFKLKGRRL